MATKKVTELIAKLKTDADDLEPKPGIVFYNIHKNQTAGVITAAKELDTMIAGTDASEAPTKLAEFNTTAKKFFTNLGNAANAGPGAIKAKLNTLVDTAEKAVLAKAAGEVDTFVKSMAGRPRSNATVDPVPMKALQDHVALRKRGLKEVQDHLLYAKKVLVEVKSNRQKGGAGLVTNQTLVKDLRGAENKMAQGGDFLKGRSALASTHSKALDEGPYPKTTVASLRKESLDAFDEGMRAMAEARDLRTEAVRELSEHELDIERVSITNLKNDQDRLDHIKKIDAEVGRLLVNATKVTQKVDETTGWSTLEKFTNEIKDYVSYKAKRDETVEAFRALPGLKASAETLDKRVALAVTKDCSPTVSKAASDVRNKMAPMNGQIKLGFLNLPKFKTSVDNYNKVWAERGEGG